MVNVHDLSGIIAHLVWYSVDNAVGETPEVSLSLERRDEMLILEMRDNGAGIDVDSVLRRAVLLGLLTKEPETDRKAVALFQLFSPGFGLDSLEAAVSRLGGSIGLDFEKNVGTKFVISLPVKRAKIPFPDAYIETLV